ncbi:MAG TPA: DUF5666 domain-containing protein [Vicinamibacteria bacterium]|nr:DUF5666 domain-containing protein [Vicinamibacteria bacterium]
MSGASASSASVQAASGRGGIRVTVVGTPISATTDSSGRFTLSDIPTGDGSVALRFEGRGINATLEISGLTPGQTLQISVQLSGNHATLDGHDDDDNEGEDDDQGEVEFKGHIESIGDSSLVVDGRTVLVDASTRIKDGDTEITLADLVVGALVEVEGFVQSDGSVLAKKIKVEDDGDGDDEDEDDDDDDEDDHDDDEDDD